MKGLKRLFFLFTLIVYVFILYLTLENSSSCSESFHFMCSEDIFEQLGINCLLFSPLLLLSVLYDIYFFLSLHNETKEDNIDNKENTENKKSIELIIDEKKLK